MQQYLVKIAAQGRIYTIGDIIDLSCIFALFATSVAILIMGRTARERRCKGPSLKAFGAFSFNRGIAAKPSLVAGG